MVQGWRFALPLADLLHPFRVRTLTQSSMSRGVAVALPLATLYNPLGVEVSNGRPSGPPVRKLYPRLLCGTPSGSRKRPAQRVLFMIDATDEPRRDWIEAIIRRLEERSGREVPR